MGINGAMLGIYHITVEKNHPVFPWREIDDLVNDDVKTLSSGKFKTFDAPTCPELSIEKVLQECDFRIDMNRLTLPPDCNFLRIIQTLNSGDLPSGNGCYIAIEAIEHGPVEIVDLP